MNSLQLKPTSEGAVLVRSLEQLLRKLVRLLVGRLSLARLQELMRTIYVQEAESHLKNQAPDGKVALARLALMTGIDTRTLHKVIDGEAYGRPMHENSGFLAEMTSETRILSVWTSDPRFFDYTEKRPMELGLHPGRRSFPELVSRAIGSRGLTIQSIVQRLEDAGSIAVDRETETVRMTASTYYPFLSNDESAMLDVGFSTAAALLQTVTANLERAAAGEEKLFQRSAFTHHLSPARQEEFRRLMTEFLGKADHDCKAIMAEVEDKVPLPDQITAGVSLFYFEERAGQFMQTA